MDLERDRMPLASKGGLGLGRWEDLLSGESG